MALLQLPPKRKSAMLQSLPLHTQQKLVCDTFLAFGRQFREEQTRLFLNHAFAWVTLTIASFLSFSGVWGRNPCLQWVECKFVIFAVFVKTAPDWQRTKTRFTKNTVCATPTKQRLWPNNFGDSFVQIFISKIRHFVSTSFCRSAALTLKLTYLNYPCS